MRQLDNVLDIAVFLLSLMALFFAATIVSFLATKFLYSDPIEEIEREECYNDAFKIKQQCASTFRNADCESLHRNMVAVCSK